MAELDTRRRAEPVGRPSAGTPGLVVAGLAAISPAVLVLALLLAGGAPEPAPAGLPDSGPATGWGLPVVRLVHHAAALATVGLLLAGLLATDRTSVPPLPRRVTVAAALVWAGAALALLVLQLSQAVGRPVGDVLRADLLSSFAREVEAGRALVIVALLALALAATVALMPPRAGGAAGRVVLLAVALSALVPPLRTGHAATATDHAVAVTSVVVHVLFVALWVGGLGALALARSWAPELAVPRFSLLALLCFVAVAASGSLSAWSRLGSLDLLWTTGYGALLIGKATVLVVLGVLGHRHRRRTVPAVVAGDGTAFRRLAVGELGLMAAALAAGVALSQTGL